MIQRDGVRDGQALCVEDCAGVDPGVAVGPPHSLHDLTASSYNPESVIDVCIDLQYQPAMYNL